MDTMPRTQRPKARATTRHDLSAQLRDIIESRGLTAYGLGKSADVDAGVIQRFLSGERDIRMETADRLAIALGVRLVEVGGRSKGKGRPTRGEVPPAGLESIDTDDLGLVAAPGLADDGASLVSDG
jgi:transcriptional regulator with XRE-family HTH domain